MTTEIERKSLSFDDVMCPVCLDIVIEPVTMSCNHELCKECYMEHFKTCDFFCPICKRRLSTWARKAIATGTLVNEKKWLLVQKEYPDLVSNKQNGNANPVFLQCKRQNNQGMKISRPGEVNAEYATMREQWLLQESTEKQLEEEASLKLIKQIQEEERKELERATLQQQQADERLAIQLSKDLEMKVSPSKVNKIILRPRRSLSAISENVPSTSRKKPYSKSTKVTPNKRKRKPSQEF